MTTDLSGVRILVVEDDYFIGTDIARALAKRGATIVGPASNLKRGLELAGAALDAAVLDINLAGEMAYPIADALAARGIPYVFATGYDDAAIPPLYSATPYFEKPFNHDDIASALATSHAAAQ